MLVRTSPRALVPAVLLVAVTGLAGCGTDRAPAPDPAARSGQPDQAPGEVHWAYDDGQGPAHWGELSDDFALCADGSHQSPVDLPVDLPGEAPRPAAGAGGDTGGEVRVAGGDAEGVVVDTGHTFQLSVDEESRDAAAEGDGDDGDGDGTRLTYDGEVYDLLQLHYHVPSEHTVAGTPAAAEFHLVHQAADGSLLVLGLLADQGDATEAVQPFVDAVDADEETPAHLDLSTLLPDDSLAYSYDGSLTTPPCTEGVRWLVLGDRITLSAAQLGVLTGAEDHNARPAQPLGDREVSGAHLALGED